ncbi:hypothetical protein AB0C28_11395 [Nonomuraea sp. NPDC048892]|uniref:hypothetical protein n=1 Tax=Nonomuraea sp. NPDC048892 TaxID=3154624 RepID=UPI0033EB76DA
MNTAPPHAGRAFAPANGTPDAGSPHARPAQTGSPQAGSPYARPVFAHAGSSLTDAGPPHTCPASTHAQEEV